MDIKPIRPRARVFADENAVPSAFPQKTLHSRHKSQPVLKAPLTTAAPQKFGTRRAFGDVSNVAVNKILKDDSALNGRSGIEKEKFVLKELDKKTSSAANEFTKPKPLPIVRPATSSIALKSASYTKPTLTDISNAPSAKPLRKAKTTIFQEKSVAEIKYVDVEPSSRPILPALVEVPATQKVQQPDLVQDKMEESTMETSDLPKAEVLQPEDVPIDPALEGVLNLDNLASDLSLVEEVPQSAILDDLEQYESALEVIPESASSENLHFREPILESLPEPLPAPLPLPLPSATVIETVHGHEQAAEEFLEVQPPNSATIPEPEEYWDVEEDEGYVDDGYVTARSFKSIGETHISGNVTRTLYPYVDQAVKREIAAAKELIESTLDPADVEDEAWDTSMVQEYGDEIFEYMRELEVRMSPNPHYMDKQTEIQWSMRSVLMDWIVQVHHRFGLLPETLFLCVNLVDRFLSQKIVSLTKLQLVGATAIFVAAKYEEVDCPSVQEINFMVDNGYGIEEILKAERFMLSMLGFELGFPGPMSFLRRISKADDYDLETRTLAKYFLEITIMDERFLTCVPSFTAAGAHCLARMMLRKGNWSPAHVYYSNYTYTQLLPLIDLMLECCEDPVHHHNAVYEKYLDRRYKQAAKYVQTELRSGFRIPEQNVNASPQMYVPVHQQYPLETHHYPTYWPQPA